MFCKRQQATGAGALETKRSSLSGVTDGIEQHNVTDYQPGSPNHS
jgi:hypothetical protein